MLKHTQSGQSAGPDETAEPIAIPNPETAPVDRAAVLARLRVKFSDQLREMRNEANRNNAAAVLADCFAWQLASCIVDYGPIAAGDIFANLGGHVKLLLEYQNAQREAEAAKEQGVQPH